MKTSPAAVTCTARSTGPRIRNGAAGRESYLPFLGDVLPLTRHVHQLLALNRRHFLGELPTGAGILAVVGNPFHFWDPIEPS